MVLSRIVASFGLLASAIAQCPGPSPAFPVPGWANGAEVLKSAGLLIEEKLQGLVADEKYDPSSFSIVLTSNTETLWSHHHSARKHNESRPGDVDVDGQSLYRIASITKTFTTLGVLYQHEAGNLSLDDPVTSYIPRDFAQGDVINVLPNPWEYGWPPASKENLIRCDEYDDYKPCNQSQFIKAIERFEPVFAPNQRSTYSNINFELLGLVLEKVTGMSYAEYMEQAIFEPLDMSTTTLSRPKTDDHAVLPVGDNYWDVDEGIQSPTGGIYSNTDDMSKWMRYILTHYNAIATGVNWLMPASWATGMQSFYGMPFETFRTDEILLESKRPVTFATKGGGLPGYYSNMIIMPEYGLGLTILVSGEGSGVELMEKIREISTVAIVRQAESLIWSDVDDKYSGAYSAVDSTLNSSISLVATSSHGLHVASFISNNTDVLRHTVPLIVRSNQPWHLQLTPTLLFKDEAAQRGEIYRMVVVMDQAEDTGESRVWEGACITDIDLGSYAGLPVNEVVFWHDDNVLELPAWRVKLKKQTSGESSSSSESWRHDL